MKYIYSEKYQEAAVIEHKGIAAEKAAEKVMAAIKATKKPIMQVTAKGPRGLVAVCFDGRISYGNSGALYFNGFGAAGCGAKNHYSDEVRRYKVRTI